jgi:hypothetical protein
VIEEPIRFGAALHRTRKRSHIPGNINHRVTYACDSADLVLSHQGASRSAAINPLETSDAQNEFLVRRIYGDTPRYHTRYCLFVSAAGAEEQAIFGRRTRQDDDQQDST